MDEFTLLFLVVTGFLASFIDSVVGGGGMISLPALLWTGMPPILALGTNKVAASMGAMTSFYAFMRSGRIDFSLIKKLAAFSFMGSVLGVYAVQLIPSDFLRPLVLVMLIFVVIYSIFKKDWGSESKYHGLTPKMLHLSMLTAFIFGFYDGFFGPGTGSFLIFALLWVGFDFLGAAANAKTLNFASNIAATVFFCYLGLVDYSYAIPMGISMIAGAVCGTRMAITKGVSYVRPLFIIMTTLLIGKQLFDMLK